MPDLLVGAAAMSAANVQLAEVDIDRIRAEYGSADRFLFEVAAAAVRRSLVRVDRLEERVGALAIAIDRCSPARFPVLREKLQARAREVDGELAILSAWITIAERCARRMGVST